MGVAVEQGQGCRQSADGHRQFVAGAGGSSGQEEEQVGLVQPEGEEHRSAFQQSEEQEGQQDGGPVHFEGVVEVVTGRERGRRLIMSVCTD